MTCLPSETARYWKGTPVFEQRRSNTEAAQHLVLALDTVVTYLPNKRHMSLDTQIDANATQETDQQI